MEALGLSQLKANAKSKGQDKQKNKGCQGNKEVSIHGICLFPQ